MSDSRKALIKLAYQKPELRDALLPVIEKQAFDKTANWRQVVLYSTRGSGAVHVMCAVENPNRTGWSSLKYILSGAEKTKANLAAIIKAAGSAPGFEGAVASNAKSLQHGTGDGRVAYSAAYKRPSEADAAQWVVGARFTSEFAKAAASLPQLPVALDLSRLYRAILQPLLPLSARGAEALPALIDRCERYQSQQRKIAQLSGRVNREKQFNRRVELNQQLNALKAELATLTS